MGNFEALRRPRFFAGQLLTAEDLSLEQDYFRKKIKRHNRLLHGIGIVSGLQISVSAGKVVIGPGLALDCEGNELVVPSPLQAIPPTGDHAFVNVRYSEAQQPDTASGGDQIIVEGVKIHFSSDNCNRNHRHLRGRWLACGNAHDLTIARLRCEKGGWRVDRRYRRPMVK